MKRLGFRTAGESHGKGLIAVLERLPAGFSVDVHAIDAMLARRRKGFGRSARQSMENDAVEILTGLKRGKTIGAPLTLFVRNKDVRIDAYRELHRPRPGHADLAGAVKFGTKDVADVMERASARETAARVAAGAVAVQILSVVGISVFGWVSRIGSVALGGNPEIPDAASVREASPVGSLDPEADGRAVALIEALREAGDTVGGEFSVVARGVPVGLGSHAEWDSRLDGRLAQALMSIPAIKSVEVGDGAQSAMAQGLTYHDPIVPDGAGGVDRPTNRAGGIEGGISNGMPIVVRGAMKPIPTVRKPLPSINLQTGDPEEAVWERSDVCSVPAVSVVAEAMAALVLLDALLEVVPSDALEHLLTGTDALRARARGLTRSERPIRP